MLDREVETALLIRPSRPIRGALRNVNSVGRDAVDADAPIDERRVTRTAKSCGPDTPTLVSSSQLRSAGDGGYQARYTGEHEDKPSKPLRRECRIASAEPVCSCACFFVHVCTRDRGCSVHPVFPAPSVWRVKEISGKARAKRAARSRNCVCRCLTVESEIGPEKKCRSRGRIEW
jgi:hypothetical protein